jgi:hypothetical protein
MIELLIAAAFITAGLGFYVGDALATRRWHKEIIARRLRD